MADCFAVDCGRQPPAAAPAARSYLGVEPRAKDFDSLLRALLDRLPRLAPDWLDRNEADLGMVLLELFAYAGDQLSYLQDRVALEGFLRTARQYESVKRLLRLIDYNLDAGAAGEAPLLFEVEGATPLFLARGFAVGTAAAPGEEGIVYETLDDAILRPAVSRVALAADAPSSADGLQARLAADLSGAVAPGDRLLLQQSDTGDPRRVAATQPAGEWVEVAAASFGAITTLTFKAPLSGRYSAAGDPARGIAPARLYGNVVRAGHGQSQRGEQLGDGGPAQVVVLDLFPITQESEPRAGSRMALAVRVDGQEWVEVEDFIDSEAADRHYRLSRSNAGQVSVHFGDGQRGAAPVAGARIAVRYRVGNGVAGQVAAERLTRFDASLRFPDPSQHIRRVRNPFAASGARDPESLEEARLMGPYRLRSQQRAVVADDYQATLAAGVRLDGRLVLPLQSRARFVDTGSWSSVFVSVDLPGRQPLAATPGLRAAFEALLAERKMAGRDVCVEDARYCPLHIALRIEVAGGHFARDVRNAVSSALAGPLPEKQPFFAAGRFGFGQAVYLSDLYAAVMAVEGVAAVAVTRFKRLGDRYPDCEAVGAIAIDALQIARCDNDPAAPHNGVLQILTCGGKEG